MKTFACALLIAAITVATPSLSSAQTEPARDSSRASRIDLRPKFKAGQSVRFKMVMKSDSGEAGGQKIEQEIVVKLTARITDPEKGSTVEMAYESLRFQLEAGGMNLTFDSTRPKDDSPTDAMLRPLIGLKMTVAFAPDGNITSVSMDDDADGVAGMIAGQFSGADVAKGIFGPITGISKGDGRAAVGESWTNEDVISGAMGSTRVSTINTLDSVKNGKANISTKGSVKLEGSGGSGLPTVNINDSIITGKAVWDLEAGMLESMKQDQSFSIDTPDTGNDPNGKVAKIRAKHTMSVEVNRLK